MRIKKTYSVLKYAKERIYIIDLTIRTKKEM